MTLSKKLIISFTFTIIISITITSLMANLMVNRRFDSYLLEEQDAKFERIRNEINKLFIEKGSNISNQDLSKLANTEGIYMEIRDLNNNRLCHSNNRKLFNRGMGGHMGGHMMGHHRMMEAGNYVERAYTLIAGEDIIGNLVIGYIDNAHLTEPALIFKDTLATAFIIAGIIAILVGLMVSIFISRTLSTPLVSIRDTANEIRLGNLSCRSEVKTDTLEIKELSQSINYLGESLEKQEEQRKKYASDIAHELRTPLTTIKSYVEALMDGVWQPNEVNLTILLEEVNRLTKLVEDLRSSFESSDASLILNKSKFNLSEELERITATFNPIYQSKDYSLETSIEKGIEVIMDRDKFRQIIFNLLSNSLRYLREDGRVVVGLSKVIMPKVREIRKVNPINKRNLNDTTTLENSIIKITIEDNGMGIKDEDLPHIFERFYRADGSRNKESGGSGLGLAIVKNLVEAHGGKIYVESQWGKGTKFTLQFPQDSISPK